MKNISVILIVLLVVGCVAWGLWSRYAPAPNAVSPSVASAPSATAPAANPAANPAIHTAPPPVFTQVREWRQYRDVREKTLADNPDLAAEYQSLRHQLEQQEKDLDAAMVKADPQVAPIVARLEAIRTQGPGSHPAATGSTPPKPAISPDDWQKIRAARLDAIKANPNIESKGMAMAADLRAFQAKLNAAMLKADPSVAPVIDRLSTPASGPKIVPVSASSATKPIGQP